MLAQILLRVSSESQSGKRSHRLVVGWSSELCCSITRDGQVEIGQEEEKEEESFSHCRRGAREEEAAIFWHSR